MRLPTTLTTRSQIRGRKVDQVLPRKNVHQLSVDILLGTILVHIPAPPFWVRVSDPKWVWSLLGRLLVVSAPAVSLHCCACGYGNDDVRLGEAPVQLSLLQDTFVFRVPVRCFARGKTEGEPHTCRLYLRSEGAVG